MIKKKKMKLKTLSYSESRETVDAMGLKQWRKIGVEVEIEEADVVNEVFRAAKSTVEAWYKESNPPTPYFQPTELPVIQSKDR